MEASEARAEAEAFDNEDEEQDEAALAIERLSRSPLDRAYKHVVDRENGFDFFGLF